MGWVSEVWADVPPYRRSRDRPLAHVESVVVDGQEHVVKLGVCLSNTKSRRAKLSDAPLAQLADLGLDWA